MTSMDRIEINPRVMLGKPVIRGTRIPVELIVRKVSEGASEPTCWMPIQGSRATTSMRRCGTPLAARDLARAAEVG